MGSQGTLAMGFDFDINSLINGSLFHGTKFNGLSSGTLEITNGATVTHLSANMLSIGTISLGTNTGNGTYIFNGTGQLSANREYIGSDTTATALFRQNGGTNSAGFVGIGQNGRYELAGGTLQINGGFQNDGTLDCAGGAAVVNIPTSSIVNFSQGSIVNAGIVSLNIPANSLVIERLGFDPTSIFNTYNNDGMTHTLGSTLSLDPGQGFAGSGNIDDPVICQGSITAGPGGFINLTGGLVLSGNGNVIMGSGNLHTDDSNSMMSGGTLSAANHFIGNINTGIFTHSAGNCTISNNLILGNNNGATGIYNHSAGTNTVSNTLYLAYSAGSSGSYNLSGTGQLSVSNEYIGYSGTGTFQHSGGSNTITNKLYLGFTSGSSGKYTLSGNSTLMVGLSGEIRVGADDGSGRFEWFTNGLTTPTLTIGSGGTLAMGFDFAVSSLLNGSLFHSKSSFGGMGPGIFEITNNSTATQAGNTTAGIWNLNIGSNTGNGTYNLYSTGSLTSSYQYIGYSNIGTFNQSSGTNTVANLYLGNSSEGNGTYNLSSTGQLNNSYFDYVGYSGTGTFNHSTGTHTVSSTSKLYLGYNSGAIGYYNLNGSGTLNAPYEYVGYSGNGTFTQSAGTNTITNYLYFGYNTGGNGSYILSGTGKLTAVIEYVGYAAIGTFTHLAGTNTVSQSLFLGYNTGANGSYDLKGSGKLTAMTEYIGYTGTGIFTQSAGTNTLSGNLYLGYNTDVSGTYNMSDTATTLNATNEYIGNHGNGTLTQTGGVNTINSTLYLGYYSGSNGEYNLNAGTLLLTAFPYGSINGGPGTFAFNFGGGTLKAMYNITTSLPMTLTGDGGNANIDVRTSPSTLSGILSGDGGLNKLGSGTLTLSGANSYNGNTFINAGKLSLTSTGSIGSTPIIDILSGATFDVSAKNGFSLGATQTLMGSGTVLGNIIATSGSHIAPGNSAGTLTISDNLTLNDGALLDFELANTAASDKISMSSSTLYLNGQDFSDFNFTALSGFGNGTYTLIDAGTISGNLGSNLTGPIGAYSGTLSISGNDLVLNVVPEPGTWVLLATMCIGLFVYWRTVKR